MNGNRKLLVDTNILIYLDSGVENVAQALTDKELFLSFVSEIELLGNPNLTKSKIKILEEMISWFGLIGFSDTLKRRVIELRQRQKIKIPDALIAATSLEYDLPLLTSDKAFANIPELQCIIFEI